MSSSTQPQPRLMTDNEVAEANRIWSEYTNSHDLSEQKGQIAAIDPKTGEIVIGHSIQDVCSKRGVSAGPALFERIGYATFYQKGGRR